jgi:conjugal transfer/entry exclusion protein
LGLAEDWDALDSAASQYQQHMSVLDDATYIQAINDAQLVEAAKAIILQIQSLNDELDMYTNLQRERVASELRQIHQSGKALDAYGR